MSGSAGAADADAAIKALAQSTSTLTEPKPSRVDLILNITKTTSSDPAPSEAIAEDASHQLPRRRSPAGVTNRPPDNTDTRRAPPA